MRNRFATAILALALTATLAGCKPSNTERLYTIYVAALDSAKSQLGSSGASDGELKRISDAATPLINARFREFAELCQQWSGSYSRLDGRIRVFVNCRGDQKTGDWRP